MEELAWGYLAALHVALAVLLLKGSRMVELWRRVGLDHPYYTSRIIRAQYVLRRVDATVPDGAVVFLGDSIIAHLAVAAVAPRAVNFGVPGARSDHLLSQMPSYRCLGRASAVVLMIGTNDILCGTANGLEDRYAQILAKIPNGVPVIFSSIPPIARPVLSDQARAAALAVRAICEDDWRCRFVDLHTELECLPGTLLRDGVHLSDEGCRVAIEMLRKAVATHPLNRPPPV